MYSLNVSHCVRLTCKNKGQLTLLTSVKYRLVLPFWYRLIRVFPDKGPLNVCVCLNTANAVTQDIYSLPCVCRIAEWIKLLLHIKWATVQ